MRISWISEFPSKPKEFLQYFKTQFKLSLEELSKLYHLTLKINSLSDSPIYKFLERTPPHIKFDEIGKREFILTLPIFTLRILLREHLDLRLVKTLFLVLSKKLPKDFFKDCMPKHSIVTSQDLIIEVLTEEEKHFLPPHLKSKHLNLLFQIRGNCEELLSLVPFLDLLVIKNYLDYYEILTSFSILEFIIFSLNLKEKNLLKEEVEKLLEQVKTFYPDCFIEI